MKRLRELRDAATAKREEQSRLQAERARAAVEAEQLRYRAMLSQAVLQPGWQEREKWWKWAAPNGLVIGESHHFDAIVSVLGPDCGDAEWIACPVDVYFQREPGNPFDTNAIRAVVHDQHVGFLPAEVAAKFASVMDGAGQPWFSVAGVILGRVDHAARIPPGVFVWPKKLLTSGPILPAKSRFEGSWGKDRWDEEVGYDPRRRGLWSLDEGFVPDTSEDDRADEPGAPRRPDL